MSVTYRIRDWDRHFENSKTRALAKLDWVLVPNRHDGSGYRLLVAWPDGAALFGCWVAILQVASRCKIRGVLIRENDQPHTAATIAAMTGLPEDLMQHALTALADAEIGWLQETDPSTNLGKLTAASPHEKRVAHGRVARDLRVGRGVMTCFGRIMTRPAACQWCNAQVKPDARKGYTTIAHHLEGYGNAQVDRLVVFVCRRCHHLMESNVITLQQIRQRTQGNAQQDGADTHHDAAKAQQPRIEENRREEKERTKKAAGETTPRLDFSFFWNLWDPKLNRGAAEKAWKKLSDADRQAAVDGLPHWLAARARAEALGVFVGGLPHASTWLNGKRWNDEFPSGKDSKATGDQAELAAELARHGVKEER